MIGAMRLSRSRAGVVLLLAILHVSSGVVSALGACCNMDVHQGSPRLMECCLKGGPNHICPFMSKSKRSKAPGKVNATCPAGHDDGVPVTGFGGVPPALVAVASPDPIATSIDAIEENAVARSAYPPTPPPRF
jgi:hypothetical protein